MKERPIYLDYAATTPVDPAAAHAMSACLGEDGAFGNASSATHEFGRRAAEVVAKARAQVAAFIRAEPDEIVFTSGATESSNLAILGVARASAHRGRHILSARTEHKAVLDPCKRLEKEGFEVAYLMPGASGVIDPAAVRAAIRPDTVLVSLMHVNNETGAIQDIAAIGSVCRELDVPFHTDAAQSAGKLPLDVEVMPLDLVSFTAHKVYGPKGIGALYVRRAIRPRLQAVSFGGGQERGLRPGTLPTHQIAGFAAACAVAAQRRESDQIHWAALRERLWRGLGGLDGVHLNAESAPRVPGILNVSFEGVEGESLVTGLAELALSTGSACSSASGEPSYVLRALGRNTELAQSSLRFSFGRGTREADVDRAIAAVRREVVRLRALSPASADSMFPPGAGCVARGEAGSPAQEAWVRFHLLVDGDVVKDARFQAYGCPHTLAVASGIAGQLAGRHRGDLVGEGPHGWARTHSVPVEKLGRLLVIEDALNDSLQHWTSSP
jgi:cysteine desulfurase